MADGFTLSSMWCRRTCSAEVTWPFGAAAAPRSRPRTVMATQRRSLSSRRPRPAPHLTERVIDRHLDNGGPDAGRRVAGDVLGMALRGLSGSSHARPCRRRRVLVAGATCRRVLPGECCRPNASSTPGADHGHRRRCRWLASEAVGAGWTGEYEEPVLLDGVGRHPTLTDRGLRVGWKSGAAVRFLETGTPEDEYFLIEFSNRAELAEDFTTDISRLRDQLSLKSAAGATALYDAVYLGLSKVKAGTNPKKALLLITDGEDNHSRYSRGEHSRVFTRV